MELRKSVISKNALANLISSFCLILFVLSTYIPFINPGLRYVKYGLFIVPLTFVISVGKLTNVRPLTKYFAQNLSLYIILFTISFLTILQVGIYFRFFNEIFLVFCPLLFVFCFSFFYTDNKKEDLIRIVFWGIFGTYLIEKGPYLFEVMTNPQLLINAIRTSTIETESGLSFLFGLFFLYFMMEGKRKYFWFSLVLCVLSFKRITLAGIFLSFIFWTLFKHKGRTIQKSKRTFSLILVLGNLSIIWVIFQLVSGQYDELIAKHTGLSTNLLLMGRYNLYRMIMNLIGDVSILGIGFGKTADILERNNFTLLNLHSDILKHFLEFGPILFSVWIFLFFYYNLKNLKLFVLALFLNVLFLSDNVFIYFEVMFLFYFLATIFISQDESKTMSKHALSEVL